MGQAQSGQGGLGPGGGPQEKKDKDKVRACNHGATT